MTKRLIFTLVLIIPLTAGCYKSIPIEENKSMNNEICLTQNNKGWLLTEEEARAALIKDRDKDEEELWREKKMEDEASEAEHKWYREHDGPLPDSFFHDYYEPLRNDFWNRVREQREIYEKYGDVNFEDFFQEFIVIEYEYETTRPWDENKKYVYQWECDLKEGLFRTIASEKSPDWVSYGRFIKDENGEWTAIYVRHNGTVKPHGYPPGGYTKEDSSPFGE